MTSQELQQLHAKIDNLQATISHLISEGIPPAKEPATGLLTRKETAKKLRITLSTLDKYSAQGRIKAHRIGGRVVFKANEIEQSLETIDNEKYSRKE